MLSLQCYSVLSTIAHILKKMSLKILASIFLNHHLSQTIESYQKVKVYRSTYSVNDLGLENFYSNIEFTGILQFADKTLYP